jgi:hypothetical protein
MALSRPLPLDAHGLLDPAAFAAFSSAPSYLVFAQQPDARIDLPAWQRHARQFFATEVALSRPKQYGTAPPPTDGAHLVLTRGQEPSTTRTILLRARTDEDLRAAELAEGGGGLALVAKRCATVALVTVEATEHDADLGSMRVAALLSSVLLGPVLSPDRSRIRGPKTMREELATRSASGQRR